MASWTTRCPSAGPRQAAPKQDALWIGTTSGAYDLAAAALPPSTLSYDVPTLPTGRTLYARPWTETNGAWSDHLDISFTTSGGAVFTSPSAGQTNFASGSLAWGGVSQAQQYAAWVGTTTGGYDVASASLGAGVTSYAAPLPLGRKLHARVWTMIGGVWVRYEDTTFTAGGGATFTAPTDAQTGVAVSQPLTWSPVATAQEYAVWVGTTPGGYDVASAAEAPGTTSFAAGNLPHARKLYARVWTMVDGLWDRYQDISFTTA